MKYEFRKKKMTTMNEFIDKSFEPLQFHIKELKERNAELAGQKASN